MAHPPVDNVGSSYAGRPALYRVTDSSLRFYLGIGRGAHELTRRGRPRLAAAVLRNRWSSWRGRAVEPVIREALSLAAPSLPWPTATEVGGWWNRNFNPELDLIGADRAPTANTIYYVGSVKWLQTGFDRDDLAELQRASLAVPGFDPASTALTGVSLAGFGRDVAERLSLSWTARDVVAAFAD